MRKRKTEVEQNSQHEQPTENAGTLGTLEAPSGEPELRLAGISAIAAPEPQLLRFAGACELSEVTPRSVIAFLAAQVEPYPEAIKALTGVWAIFRGSGRRGGVAGEVWTDIKERFPEPEWPRQFKRIVAEYPFIYPSTFWRDQAKYLEGLCLRSDDHDTRKYFLPRVPPLLASLPEWEFAARNCLQKLLDRYTLKENENGTTN